MKDLKAVTHAPSKDEAERMYKIAYYLDKKFLRPIDVVDLGIDVYKLKECGEVRMAKSPSKIKPYTAEIWGRMTESMRAMFLWSYLCEEIDSLRATLRQLKPIAKNVRLEELALDSILNSMSIKLPPELQAKIKEGFGREWGK